MKIVIFNDYHFCMKEKEKKKESKKKNEKTKYSLILFFLHQTLTSGH